MQCGKCGSANAEDSRFCTSCGSDLQAQAASQPPPAQEAPAAQPVYAPPPQTYAQPSYAPPPAAPPAYAPPAYAPSAGYAAPPPAPAPKKKRGCLIAVVVLAILMLCCCGSLAAAYFGFVSLGKPKDLGVKYTQKDYDSATSKLGVDVSKASPDSPTARGGGDAAGVEGTGAQTGVGDESAGSAGGATAGGTTGSSGGGTSGGGGTSAGTGGGGSTGSAAGSTSGGGGGPGVPASGPAAGTVVIYEGSVPVDITLTNEEFSALISLNHYSPNWLVKDMQVKFGDGNTIEMSGYIEYEGQRYPVYVAGIAEVTGPKTVGGTATAVSVSGYDVPAEYYPYAAEFLASLMNDWLAQMDGLSLESVEIANGLVHIKGTVPATVIRVPATQ